MKFCCCFGVEEVITLGCYCYNNNNIHNSSEIYEYNYIITTITTIQIYTNKLTKKYNYISLVLVKFCCCPGVEEVVTLGCYCCNNNIHNCIVIYEYYNNNNYSNIHK